jgi:hypothetical protein
MNSSERVRKAIEFDFPDRVPISHAVLPAAQLKYGAAMAEILTEFREDFGWDTQDDLPLDKYPALYKKGQQADDFGTLWKVEWDGICGIPIDHPIKDLERWREYHWPETFSAGPPSGRQYSGHMRGSGGDWYARGAWITYFEQMQQLRGMENFLADIALETNELIPFMDAMLEFNLNWIDQWASQAYEGVQLADDWGGQRGLIIKPDTWRKLFKHRYAEMFKKVHDANMHVWFHSDGRINEIIPDLIEIGVDVINCQVSIMGHDWVRDNMKGRVAIRTDIDRQWILPFGTETEVKEEVKRTFEACGGPEGGIIACGEISPDVPLCNIRAMYEAFVEYGNYS